MWFTHTVSGSCAREAIQLAAPAHVAQRPPRAQENEAQIKEVAAKLRGSIEALCDKLKDNPTVAENMAKVASERQGLQGLLARSLEQLQSMRRIPCITEAVLAEQSRCAQLCHSVLVRIR